MNGDRLELLIPNFVENLEGLAYDKSISLCEVNEFAESSALSL